MTTFTGNFETRYARLIRAVVRHSAADTGDASRWLAAGDAAKRLRKAHTLARAVDSAKSKLTVLEYNALALAIIQEHERTKALSTSCPNGVCASGPCYHAWATK